MTSTLARIVASAALVALTAGCTGPSGPESSQTPSTTTQPNQAVTTISPSRLDPNADVELTGERVYSLDNGYSIMLPEGWNDGTAEFAKLDSGSAITAAWMTTDTLNDTSGTFATASSKLGVTADVDVEGDVAQVLESFRAVFGEVAWIDPGVAFTTDEGDVAWVGAVSGDRLVAGSSTRTESVTTFVFAVASDRRYMRIYVDAPPEEADLAAAFVAAAHTIELYEPDTTGLGRAGEPPVEDDGLVYSYARNVAMPAPPKAWRYIYAQSDDLFVGQPAQSWDYLGTWDPFDGAAGSASYAILSRSHLPGQTAEAYLEENFGAVGTTAETDYGSMAVNDSGTAKAHGKKVAWVQVTPEGGNLDGTYQVVLAMILDDDRIATGFFGSNDRISGEQFDELIAALATVIVAPAGK